MIKQRAIEAAKENGTIDKVNQMFSSVHILHCQAQSILTDIESLLKKNGLLIGDLKREHNRVMAEYDKYFVMFTGLMGKNENLILFKDMEDFEHVFNNWVNNVPFTWEPKNKG
jgi:hypothetical protein